MSVTITDAPSDANFIAIARPIPVAAPVTSAICPSFCSMSFSLLNV